MMGGGQKIDYLKEGNEGRLAGISPNEGVIGMIKEKDFKNLNLLSPFHGQRVEVCCGNSITAPKTDVLTQYFELFQTIWRKGI